MLPVSVSAQTEIAGEVSGEWTAEDSPYIVVDSTWVPEDEELVIQPGVEIYFGDTLSLDVYGTINAEGSEDDSVLFTARENVESGHGIKLFTENKVHRFEYCNIINSDRGLLMWRNTLITIENSRIICNTSV